MINIREEIPGKKGFINLTIAEDYEYLNPIEKLSEMIFNRNLNILTSAALLKPKELENAPDGIDVEKVFKKVAFDKATIELKEFLDELRAIKLPDPLLSILTERKKADQIRALDKISLESNELMAFIITAFEKHGFLYSMYTSSHLHKGLDKRKMPRFAIKEDDGSISSVGQTTLSSGQIKSAIDQRINIIARFLDKGSEWHCFYYTYNSIGGKEVGGIPHIHYISHSWGLTRVEVLRQLKSRHYKLPRSPHIPFERYR